MWPKALWASALVVGICFSTAPAKSRSSEQSLEKAKQYITSGKERQARALLEDLLNSYRLPRAAEEAFVLLTDLYVKNKNYEDAVFLVDHFIHQFPESPERARMEYYLGIVQLQERSNFQAALTFAKVLSTAQSKVVYRNAYNYLRDIIKAQGLRLEELEEVVQQMTRRDEAHAQLLIALGNAQLKAGENRKALYTYDKWLTYFPKHRRARSVKKIHKDLLKRPPGYRTLLVMLPITGAYSEVGLSLSRGIILGLENRLEKVKPPVRYKIIDTHGDPVTALKKLRTSLKSQDVLGVIGPAMSDVSLAAAIELSNHPQVPMITPSATTHGISLFGSNIYQLNITTFTLGSMVAGYADSCLNLKEFAILAPNTEYGLQLSHSFEKTVEEQGGSIIAKQFYAPEEKDYSGHFKVIRMRKVKSDLQREWRGLKRTRRGISQKRLHKSVKDSVVELDGVFIPASNAEEAHKLSSQTHYHKLKTRILGSSGWHDESLFQKGFRNTLGTVISTDHADGGKYVKAFNREFRNRWDESADEVAALGFNAARFALEALGKSPDNLNLGLQKVNSFSGVYGPVNLHPQQGYNLSARLLQAGKKGWEPATCPEKKKR